MSTRVNPGTAFDPAALATASEAQRRALHPRQQVWISANAGTGKTEVLTRRLVTLLLSEAACAPAAVLALTYTKAGAAEMLARLPRKLTALLALDEAALQRELAAMGVEFNAGRRAQLHKVLVQVEQHPPVIRTLHGFAGDLLRRFPNEARAVGIDPGFTQLDDPAQKRLLQDAQARALGRVEGEKRAAVDLLLAELGEFGWQELTKITTKQWRKFSEMLGHAGGEATLMAQLHEALGLRPGQAPLPLPVAPLAMWRKIKPGKYVVEPLARIITALTQDEVENLGEELEKFWCTDGKLRQSFTLKAATDEHPELAGELLQESANFMAWLHDQAARQTLELTGALIGWGAVVQEQYTALKRAAGVVDYQDLLDAAEALLRDENVLVTLSKLFRHLVVDEAQDNNAQQARLAQVLAGELLAAQGADGLPRTVLAVGDVKQSIYRFQGAQPEYFHDLRQQLEGYGEALDDGRPGMLAVNLAHSFRSGPTVLKLVDAVFADPALAAEVTGRDDEAWPAHVSLAPARAGRVEVWPLAPRAPKLEIPAWTLPMDRAVLEAEQRVLDGERVCAAQVATRLVRDMRAGVVVPSTGRPLEARDVLILTQKNSVADVFRQVLRAHGLPVAGGRLTLATPALQDVVALLRAVQNPRDRVSLAVVLKSPLMQALGMPLWDDAALLTLLQAGPDSWGELGRAAVGVHRQLQALRVQAGMLAPGVLVAQVWQQFAVAARYARQPVEVAELQAAGEALVKVAAAESTLAGLLVRLEDEDFVLELEEVASDAVRVLTMFKAKGLEAPLVVLVDTTQPLVDLAKEKLGWLEYEQQWRGVLVRLPGAAKGLAQRIRIDEQEKKRQRADRLRQLYVALTRAKDWLWVAGWEPYQRSEENWYGLVSSGLARLPGVVEHDGDKVLAEGPLVYDPQPLAEQTVSAAAPVLGIVPALELPLWDDPAAPVALLAPVDANRG